jgi:hypothetical protein
MSYATPAQIDLIRSLSGKSVQMAAMDYGFAPGHSLSVSDASEIIDSLKAPAAPIMSEEEIAEYRANRDAAAAAQKASEIARHAAAQNDTARFDAILIERGLGHLTGADRREARRLIRREFDAKGE